MDQHCLGRRNHWSAKKSLYFPRPAFKTLLKPTDLLLVVFAYYYIIAAEEKTDRGAAYSSKGLEDTAAVVSFKLFCLKKRVMLNVHLKFKDTCITQEKSVPEIGRRPTASPNCFGFAQEPKRSSSLIQDRELQKIPAENGGA